VLELSGGEMSSLPDQVAILSRLLDKPIRCVYESSEEAIQRLIRAGVPAQTAASVAQSFEALGDERVTGLRDTVERMTGRRPKTFESWTREHVQQFI
jgi:(4-alkanoyl-5-oxo-2,5-dihydrofuran-3-yl)methyl phosphate reductase